MDRSETPLQDHSLDLSLGRMHYIDDTGHFVGEELGEELPPMIAQLLGNVSASS